MINFINAMGRDIFKFAKTYRKVIKKYKKRSIKSAFLNILEIWSPVVCLILICIK